MKLVSLAKESTISVTMRKKTLICINLFNERPSSELDMLSVHKNQRKQLFTTAHNYSQLFTAVHNCSQLFTTVISYCSQLLLTTSVYN